MAYLFVIAVCFMFYLIFRGWFCWLLCMTVAFLPVFSLLLSLPAMLTARVSFQCPAQGRMGVPAKTALRMDCRFPAPPVRCRIRLHNRLTGERYVGQPGEYVPVQHCGLVEITFKYLYICDYLGLFGKRIRYETPGRVYVLPRTVPDREHFFGEDGTADRWKPKAGGFSEHHELRLYQPGDDLRLIHWKMAAKTGKLIYREPVVQDHSRVCIVLTLSGTPAQIDDKLGRCLWVSQTLLSRQIPHQVRCRTGLGEETYEIWDRDSQEAAMHALLEGPATAGEWTPTDVDADRLYRIGGGL